MGLWAETIGYARVLAGVVLVTSTGIVAAWVLGIRWLTTPIPTVPSMKVNTAVALVLLSASVLVRGASGLQHRPAARGLAVAAAALALVTVAQDAFGRDLGIDQLLANDPTTPGAPGRMAVTTAIGILLLATALAWSDRELRGRRIAHGLAVAAMLVSFLAAAGYLYGADALVAPIGLTGMALPTSLSLLAIAVSVLLLHPDTGIVRWLLRRTPGAVVARRLVPVIALVYLLIGWLGLSGERVGWYGRETGTFLVGIVGTATGLLLLTWVIRGVDGIARVRHQAEEALRRSELHYRSLFQHSVEIAAETELDTTVRFISPSVERIMGYTPEELEGRPVAELIHPEDLVAAIEAIRRGLTTPGEPQTVELRLVNAAGAWRVLEVAGRVVLGPDGEAPTMMLNAHDVTERYEVQRRLEDSRHELERSNEELEQFAYVASHDLQEPLRMVTSHLQLLAEDLRGTLDGEQAESLAFAVDGATRMQQMIRDLLSYSRVDTRGKPFEPTPMGDALATALGSLELAIAEAGAVVTSDPLPTVQADPGQMVQLLQNLIANAIKFRGSEPPSVHVDAVLEQGLWRFGVRDNGIGIAPEHAERVFQVFQRLHTRTEYEGTGIGLAICRRIVERHGGNIWIESEPGRGCEIRFTIASTPVAAVA
jgi:PAS domain S-box-containing protein